MAFTGVDQFKAGTITREEVLSQWGVYVDQFKTTDVDPILTRMNQAKNDYFNAVLDLQDKMDGFRKEIGAVAGVVDQLNLGGAKTIDVEPVHNPNSFITAHELQGLALSERNGKRTFKGVTIV